MMNTYSFIRLRACISTLYLRKKPLIRSNGNLFLLFKARQVIVANTLESNNTAIRARSVAFVVCIGAIFIRSEKMSIYRMLIVRLAKTNERL